MSGPTPPKWLRAPDGSLSSEAEVAWLRERAMGDWLDRHGLFDVTPEQLAARVAEVGEDVATAEFLAAARADESGI